MKTRFLPLTLLIFCSNIVYAQYRGGQDDGIAIKSIASQNQTPNIFKGGVNDGTSIQFTLGQNAIPSIYMGGANDGIANTNALGQNTQPGIYYGGSDDGNAITSSYSQNALINIYSGGGDDGVATIFSSLQNPSIAIYHGGGDDGTSSYLSSLQNSIPSIYFGGENDGYATVLVFQQNSIYGLPIELFYFNGKWQDNDAVLSWQTNSSIELEHMELERSIDGGLQFEKIADIMPLALDQKQNYNYTDRGAWQLPPDFLLYRLKLVSNKKPSTYSTIVKLEKDRTAAIISAYPNPTLGKLTFNIQNVSDFKDYEYQLYTIDGKLMQQGNIQTADTYLDLQGYAAGTYQLIIFGKGTVIQKFKIILSH